MDNVTWEMVECNDSEWRQDESGIYTIINRVANRHYSSGYSHEAVSVRVDVLSTDDEPIISFTGSAIAVRKDLSRWLQDNKVEVSLEHAMYIGDQISRAFGDMTFIQD